MWLRYLLVLPCTLLLGSHMVSGQWIINASDIAPENHELRVDTPKHRHIRIVDNTFTGSYGTCHQHAAWGISCSAET